MSEFGRTLLRMSPRSNHAAVYVERVTLRNFRGITDAALALEPDLTVLVGRNNVGKSRLLRAVGIALGTLPAERDDLTVGGPHTSEIEIILAPRTLGSGEEHFDPRVQRRILNVQLVSDSPERERFGWLTRIAPSQEGNGVRSESTELIFDAAVNSWQITRRPLGVDRTSLVAASFVDTGRDLTEELGRRGSAIRRILDDLEIPPTDRAAIESAMTTLSSTIITSSAALTAVTEALAELTNTVSSIGSAQFSALPGRIEELSRTISIDFDTGGGHLPVRLHGSGSRSLASLQVRNVMYDRRLGRDRGELRPQPVTLVEEPEAHLHPQAHFELSDLLSGLTGQAVVSTHSAHLVTSVDPRSIRLVRETAGGLRVIDFHPVDGSPIRGRQPGFHQEEMDKLKRTVERPFGELLFASAVVVGDGATERAMLPVLIRWVLGSAAAGVTVVDPGSMSNAQPVIKFAGFADLPWLLFSDADSAGVAAARRLDVELGNGDEATITWVGPPGGSIAACEAMFAQFDPALCRAALSALKPSSTVPADDGELVKAMTKTKGALGRHLAAELITRRGDRARALDEAGYWPQPIQKLLAKLRPLLEGGRYDH